jgi:hypothetical protein
MTKTIKIGYENRDGVRNDLPAVPKLILANHFLSKVSNISVGDLVSVEYFPNQIIITKSKHN